MKRPSHSRGFSLLEGVIVLLILGLLSAGTVALFSFGTRGFQQAVLRQGLLGESERFRNKLKADYKPSHQGTLSVISRDMTLADGTVVRRDAFAFASLADWKNPASFTTTGLPRWNRYIVYYSTLQEPGRLIRQVLDVSVLFAPVPYHDLNSNVSELPLTNANVVQTTILSKNVLSLEAERNDARQLLEVSLRLRDGGQFRVNSGAKVEEVQQSVFSLEALNTYPRL